MPPTPGRPIRLTRRAALGAAALGGASALLAACTGGDAQPAPSASAAPPDEVAPESLAARVAAEESALIAAYDAALTGLTGLDAATVALLTTLRDDHIAHRDALGGSADATADPPGAVGTLRALLVAEREATRARIRACVDAADPALARLLSLIAASESAHVACLREAGS